MGQSLFFNILTFDWPKKNVPFYFHQVEQTSYPRLHRRVFPNNIDSIFPDLTNSDQKFIATTYEGDTEGFTPLEIDFKTENPDLIKQFYNRKLKYYFQKKRNQIVKTNFIKENQLWIPTISKEPKKYKVFDKYTLKVQLGHVTDFPELVISYDGQSKVWNTSVGELLAEVSPQYFNWVLYENTLRKYKELATLENADYNKAFPIVGKKLKIALELPTEAPSRENRYKSYLAKIESFLDAFIRVKEFQAVIPLHNTKLVQVSPIRVNVTAQESNKLTFGNDGLDIVPFNGVKTHGPYKKSPYNKVHLFFIAHESDKPVAIKLNEYFTKGLGFFKGLQSFAQIIFHTEKNFSIFFQNKDNPIDEIQNLLLNDRNIDRDLQYIAIYITPFTKFEADLQKREIYYKVKELLLKRGITSQCIDANKVMDQGESYVYSLPNIAVAILAKLKGTPWRLNTPKKNELVVGIGAFKHTSLDVQYIGSAFSFDNTGHFNNFEYFMKSEVDILAGSIVHSVREYASVNSKPERLIIHFYKSMSDKELEPIEKGLRDLGLDIPVFIVTINKTESEDILVFDTGWKELMPLSGTYINIGSNRYLLCNNTRYSTTAQYKATDGYPFPIKLKIDCNKPKELEQTQVIKDLIDQVYQFSRMYWKSVRQQNLPVTIKYPEMVAQIAPHFDGDEIPQFGRDNLWFL